MNKAPILKVVIIVQARMGAARLPGKPLKKVLNRPLLSFLIERLKRCRFANEIVIATTDSPADRAIVKCAEENGVTPVSGSEEDVLSRYLIAAQKTSADVIVRITADCPFSDPAIIDQAILQFIDGSFDYLSNVLQRTYPRGLDVEVFSRKALEKAFAEAKKREEREHVTLYLYRHPELFSLENFSFKQDESKYRWTVDTPEDFELIKTMIEYVYPNNPEFSFNDLLKAAHSHPEWYDINQSIHQKPL